MCHLRTNTPGQFDGFLEVYWDGVLTTRYTGLEFRSSLYPAKHGKISEAVVSFFFNNSVSPRTNLIYLDNFVVARYKPSAVNYNLNFRERGTVVSQLHPPVSELNPVSLLTDEVYTNSADTIFDIGNGKDYIYWPPYQYSGYVTKTINVYGSKCFQFLKREWGYGNDGVTDKGYWVKVYSGVGSSKTLLYTFGRTSDGYTDPGSTVYPINGPFTVEIHTGFNSGNTFGTAIRYY
jgi:hypothetical protein